MAVCVAVALGWGGAAHPAPGDPKRRLNPSDQAVARSTLLRRADLPAGAWRSLPTDFSPPNPGCIIRRYSLSALTATGEAGLTYDQGGGVPLIESDAHVFKTRIQEERALAILTGAGFGRCFGSSLAAAAGSGGSGVSATLLGVETISIRGLPVPVRGFHVAVRLHSSRGDTALHAVVLGLAHRRVLATLSLVNIGAPWPQSGVRSLAAKVAARAARV